MTRMTAFDPDTEVLGLSLLTLIEMTGPIQPFLEERGLTSIDPDHWYPLRDWLAVLNDITASDYVYADFFAAGVKMIELLALAQEATIPTADQIAANGSRVYQTYHRNGSTGTYAVEKVDERHFKITVRSPYPDEFDYGVTYGNVRHILPPGSTFRLWYDPDHPRREQGGDATIIHVSWW